MKIFAMKMKSKVGPNTKQKNEIQLNILKSGLEL